MDLHWSSQRDIANSKIVKSSAFWLIIVPLTAKMLDELDGTISMTIFGGNFKLITSLPFSWQLLFFAAVFFTIAGIIYSVFCPDIIKKYSNFSEFESDGKTRMQINHAFKKVTWDYKNSKPKAEYIPFLVTYFNSYSNISETTVINDETIEENAKKLFDDIASNKGKNSNAFYFVHEVSDKHRQKLIWTSLAFYILGFCHIAVIAIENIAFVVKSMG
ncbi:hypothetical protein EHS89_16085 [Amphritea balenae]|uniref:Uncharacterized protein n=1 Tax=Amphritea balenae TaxID=452629 RepID=A0A3P1SL89_9GAMM|nr:hypothetical protein [Amphritea balenae]RRC97699.1 hypothetical protein EHS89_16085 [Amphritea balenae]